MDTEQTFNRWFLKACVKCNGDMCLAKDGAGYYRKCITCGRNENVSPEIDAAGKLPVAA